MRSDRPKRSKSPSSSSSKASQRKRLPVKRPDPGTEDFIRFVREFQSTKQPTFTSVYKRAPLPEIGHSSNVGLNDSGFLEKYHNDDFDNLFLDNHIVHAGKVSHPRNDKMIKEMLTITRQQTRDNLFTTHKSIAQDCIVISRQTNKSWSLPQTKQMKCSKSKTRKSLKHLPPLYQDDFPDRPSAPSPSRTPPLNISDEGSEDQVEFLDLS